MAQQTLVIHGGMEKDLIFTHIKSFVPVLEQQVNSELDDVDLTQSIGITVTITVKRYESFDVA